MRFVLPVIMLTPIIEILVLIEVGERLGAVQTVGLVLMSAVLGLFLLRRQGLVTLLRASRKMAQGGLPAEEIVEGLLLAVGGILFLVPGFVTDAVGLLCLLPLTRRGFARYLIRKGFFLAPGFTGDNPAAAGFYSRTSGFRADDAIEGEFSRDDRERLH